VLHYEEEDAEPVVLEEVELTGDGESEPETLVFQTEGFSVFAVVTVAEDTSTVEAVDITDTLVSNLGGKSYVITGWTGEKAMMAQTNTSNGLTKVTVSSTSASAFTQWTFTSDGNGGYYISSDGNYLMMSYSDNRNGILSLTDDFTNATAFTVSTYTYNGAVCISISATVGGVTYYINQSGGDSGTGGFVAFYNSPANGGTNSILSLYTVTTSGTSSGDVAVTDLGGKSYAIVNLNNSSRTYALLSTAASVSGRLNAGAVTVVESDEETYVTGDDITVWKFIETGTAGVYYIYDETNQVYLNINSSGIYVSATQQEITVTTSSTYPGQVRLSNGSGMAVNWFGNNASAYGDVFGAYSYTGGQNEYMTLCEVVDSTMLLYDLNLAGNVSLDTYSGSGWYAYDATSGTWVATNASPSIDSTTQEVTGTGSETLYSVSGKGDNGYYTYVSGRRYDLAMYLSSQGESPGKEFRFDGWSATVTDDSGTTVTYTFAEDAEIEKVDADGNIYIYDTSGKLIALPNGTVLTGIWTEISDIVMFFVNYSGTVLDVEGNVSGRNQKEFTGIIAIGHVYFGTTSVGDDATFAADANESIKAKFVNEFDSSSTDTQIVITYVTTYDASVTSNSSASDSYYSGAGYNLYTSAEGINASILEEYLMRFIRENSNLTIQISTAEGNNPAIENENATTANYEVRWYVLKEQVDGWHIDGVMVAKTEEMIVTKNFNGLTETVVDDILESYQMPLKLGTTQQDYVTIKTTKTASGSTTVDGVYDYSGKQGDLLSYRWVLHLITNEQYTLSEENYTLSGYDVCTIAEHYYLDDNGNTVYVSGSTDTSEDLSEQIVGGTSTSFIFNNFYTPTGTGMLAVIKTDEAGTTLSGATFTLTKEGESAPTATITSDSNGLAFFNDLDEGIYYLEETDSPSGYQESTAIWKVVVEKYGTSDEYVKVTVYASESVDAQTGEVTYSTNGTVCYDSGATDGNSAVSPTMQYLQVENEVANTTVVISKVFSGLSYADLEELYAASTSDNDYASNTSSTYDRLPYYIELTCDGETPIQLYLQDASRSQTGYTFTWTLTDVAAGDWAVTEYNYLHEDYTDTAVTATVNDDTMEVKVETSTGNTTASITATLSDNQKDTVTIYNNYTNTFTLSLSKVDSVTGEALTGALFDIYGFFAESTDTSKSITFTDADQTQHTLYYIDQIKSGADGIATIEGLTLSDDSNVFAYVLDESKAPEGYAASTDPIVITVAVGEEGYSTGVYSVTFPNTKVTSLSVTKVWDTNTSSTPDTPVTLVLYRQSSDGTVETVGSITLNGKVDEYGESKEWTALWENLEVYDETTDTSSGIVTYGTWTYYVTETTVDGYETTYSLNYTDLNNYAVEETEALTVSAGNGGTETVDAVEATMGNSGTLNTVTVINSAVYELPKTGGTGEWPCYLASLLLAAATLLIYKHLKTD